MHDINNASSSDNACNSDDAENSDNADKSDETDSSDDKDNSSDLTARLITASVVRLIADWLDEIDW